MMERRTFLVLASGSFLTAPLVVAAQPVGQVYRIGFLRAGQPPKTWIESFQQGLRERGYVEGQSLSIEYALADSTAQLPTVVTELVRRKVDVIVASGTPSVPPAKSATSTIPIIFVASIDPVATGMVASLARPGGNVTGLAGIHADLMGKRLEIVRETVPKLSRVALYPTRPTRATPNTSSRRSLLRGLWECSCNWWRFAMPATSSASLTRPERPTP